MPFILLALVAVASILVAGISAVNNSPVVLSNQGITPAASGIGLSVFDWVLIVSVIVFCAWRVLRWRKL